MTPSPRAGAGAIQPAASGLAAMLTTMRARLMVMLLLIVLPLFGFAAVIAWASYSDAALRLHRQVDVESAAGVALVAHALDDARQLMQAVASLPVVLNGSPEGCDATLQQVLQMEQPRYDEIAVFSHDGQLRCRSGLRADAAASRHLAGLLALASRPGPDFLAGDPAIAPRFALPARLRVTGNEFSGAILAELSRDGLLARGRDDQTPPRRVMALVDAQGRITPLDGAVTPGAAAGSPEGEQGYRFRSAPLPGGLRLRVGLSTVPQLREAREALVQRLGALGVLLATGLLAMAAGVTVTVVEPVRRLSAAVARWRDGGGFKPGSPSAAPREIAALSLSFGRAVAALNQRELQLREAAMQQELLMQEIHHRVKNNLQIVASLLNLQASRIKLPEARAEFQAARDRIRALATLHRHLYAYGELHTINMRSFLIELCSQLLQALGETTTGGRIRLDIEAPELRISSDQAVPMALIVTEAVSNAAKYAFPGGRSGHIAVRLLIMGEGTPEETLRLTIEDDGVGIATARPDSPTEARDGIGTHLIRGFARQLKAEMSLTHEVGTRYVLDIPTRRGHVEAPAETMPEA